jgi:diguanylate cyclase (GGDEF)-like protein/PAS domain S-box-containing protein
VICAVGVVAAMIVIAGMAQRDAERHQHVQVVVERAHADSQQVAAIVWQGVDDAWATGREPEDLINHGFVVWAQLTQALSSLRRSDSSPATRQLLADANRLQTMGTNSLLSMTTGRIHPATASVVLARTFAPAIAALDRDSLTDARAQERVANQASTRERRAYLGSVGIGVLVLLLLGLGLHRMRRAAVLGQARRALERRSEDRVRALIEHSSDVITVVGRDLVIRWQSPSVQRILGRAAEELIGGHLTEHAHPDDVVLLKSHVGSGLDRPGTVTFTARFRHADGEWRYLETIAESRLDDPDVAGVVLSMRDITERKALEEELRHQAFHDALTGLANRALFEDRLAHALAAARRHARPVAVLFLDLDDFKTINDSLGHATGDELLRAVAIRLAGVVRVTDTAARLGGDEFAVLLEIMDDAEADADTVAERMLEALRVPFEIGGRELRITASVGLAKSDGTVGVDELLRNADTAMYAAKESGKGTAQAFEAGMHERVLDKLELTGELQRALEREEFVLDYQPIVELETGRITGAEALVRWAHPTRGRLAPGHFITLAETTGLIVPLGDWILHTACAQAAEWHRAFPERALDMNVNVSTRQLHDPAFPGAVSGALAASGLPAHQLVLEITESLLPEAGEEIIAQLRALKDLGVRVAVDDFGTGYSALSRLRAYPVDILKIDRTFIDGIERDAGKGQLVRGIVNLGESLQLQVVAEGIEEREQADQLRRMRSPLGQGFLFSRPLEPERMSELLREGRPLTAPESPLPR